jgi:phosphoribosylglycinamide formyltransferase-1
MDACAREYTKAVVTVVLSDNPDAYGLVRAQNAGIDTCVVKPSDYPDRDTHNAAMGEILERYSVGLVCLAGYMRVLAPSFVKKFKNRMRISQGRL